MSEKIVLTSYNHNNQPATSNYLWVYSQCECENVEEEKTEELAFNHPPVLDWQSGLENLKEHQIEPVTQEKIEEKPKEEEESCDAVDIVVIEEPQEKELISIQQLLDKMLLSEESQLLQRFLTTKSSTHLLNAIDALQYKDPVSFYQLRKFAQKLKIN